MNEIIQGIVQGLTEFLPISSSGHIVFLEKISGFKSDNLAQLQIALHLGTLLSILIYYFKDIKELVFNQDASHKKYMSFIFVGTLPLIIMSLFWYENISNLLNNSSIAFEVASYCILITGFILLLTKLNKSKNNIELTYFIVLIIGTMQCLAVLPGISRSGITICSAILLGISNKNAAKFSFLLAIPAILGSGILEVKDMVSTGGWSTFPYWGFIASFVVGYISLRVLIFITYSGRIWYFSIYCFIIGLLSILKV